MPATPSRCEAAARALTRVWAEAVRSCDAAALTRRDLERGLPGDLQGPGGPIAVLALGKASLAMAAGAAEALGERVAAVFAVAPGAAEVPDPLAGLGARLRLWRGEHPVPGAGSFAAGAAALAFADEARARGWATLGLVSGGASALCEHPAAGWSAERLALAHRALVASGASIEVINARRRALSALKGGRLGHALGPALRWVRVLADVPSGAPEAVGSGPFTPPEGPLADTRVLAAPLDLAAAAVHAGRAQGLDAVGAPVLVDEWPLGLGREAVLTHLTAGAGLWVGAGEVTVPLPEAPGEGGRAQHFALAVLEGARALGRPWAFLAAGSDGCDGAGAAGAVVHGGLRASDADLTRALTGFDAGPLLATLGARLPEAPPRTNLTDLYLAWAG